jgi:threonine dehydrogenase-like Zn-dependent dehydrogenase
VFFAGAVDKFPLGAVINKGLTVRGTQQHGRRYIPMLLERLAAGELSTAHLATHTVSLDEVPRAYDMFKQKLDGCVRGHPAGRLSSPFLVCRTCSGRPGCP